MSVRLRRLKADYEAIRGRFSGDARIRIVKTIGDPPEKYQVEYLVTSLAIDPATQKVHYGNSFMAEIVLTAAYPRMAPQCRMLTPVFHPNIAPHAICIGDHWAAGESLAQLIVRIAEMLSFQSYNVKSPLNGEAAKWVEQNAEQLPVDKTDFASMLSAGEAAGRNADGSLRAEGECANCGKHGGPAEMQVCAGGHVACSGCTVPCPVCGKTYCLQCTWMKCELCGRNCCGMCVWKCNGCGRLACAGDGAVCRVCGLPFCSDCTVGCVTCGQPACVEHVSKAGADVYVCHQCSPVAKP
jgi:ubiquitin-protein ligase